MVVCRVYDFKSRHCCDIPFLSVIHIAGLHVVRETARGLIKIWFLLLLPLLATFNKLNILPRGGGFAREREIKREKDRERERERERERKIEKERGIEKESQKVPYQYHFLFLQWSTTGQLTRHND